MELTWIGNTVEIGVENGKRRIIFEDNLEKFSPKKLNFARYRSARTIF